MSRARELAGPCGASVKSQRVRYDNFLKNYTWISKRFLLALSSLSVAFLVIKTSTDLTTLFNLIDQRCVH